MADTKNQTEEVFLTAIEYGKPSTFNEDTGAQVPGEVVHYDEGSKVSDADLPKEVVDELRAVGSVGEPAMSAAQRDEVLGDMRSKNEQLEAEVAELRAQLTASGGNAGSGPAGPTSVPGPGAGGTQPSGSQGGDGSNAAKGKNS
jgi:hypothetical protein